MSDNLKVDFSKLDGSCLVKGSINPNYYNPPPSLKLYAGNGEWYIKINEDKIEFNEKLKLTSDEFAKEFIRILENDGFGLGIKGKIRELIRDYNIGLEDYRNEADECNWEKGYLMEDIISDLERLVK